jgi:HEAT repeat protein
MVRAGMIVRAFAVSALLAAPALAGVEEELSQAPDRAAAVEKLVAGLCGTDRAKIQESAFALGEARAKEAVIPLMAMLHDGEEPCRIVAALALSRIGDERAAFAVKQAARFDESPKVRTLAAWFYEQYVQAGTYKFVVVEKAGKDALGMK